MWFLLWEQIGFCGCRQGHDKPDLVRRVSLRFLSPGLDPVEAIVAYLPRPELLTRNFPTVRK